MVCIDTETTGTDLRHAARPFFVSVYDDEKLAAGLPPDFYEWDVDPVTREVNVLECDVDAIEEAVMTADGVVMQNAKFDVAAIGSVAPWVAEAWPWDRTHDTLMAGHLLASNQKHTLDWMLVAYLGIDITPYETALAEAVKHTNKLVHRQFPTWRLSKAGMDELPSAKEKTWQHDYWLTRAYAQAVDLPETDLCWTVLRDYACHDAPCTLALWHVMEKQLRDKELWRIYEVARQKLPEIAYLMETRGITVSNPRLTELQTEFKTESDRHGRACLNIATGLGYNLTLPKGASPNNSLRTFMHDVLKVPPVYSDKSKTAAPTLNKEAMGEYLLTLPPGSKELAFVRNLARKRIKDTSLQFMESYRRFMVPVLAYEPGKGVVPSGTCRLHPQLNPTGTATLRWSCANPNEQNISGKESECVDCDGEGKSADGETCRKCLGKGTDRTVRYAFGPAPGREWWSIDAKNIERRIPVYRAGQQDIIDLFERPDDPPYFGNEHLLVFSILHPEEFARHGAKCKKLYPQKYKKTKNGNFAVQYQAGDRTADRAYGVKGARAIIKKRFDKLEALNQQCIKQAEVMGYVTTIPDQSVDPDHGYPLWCGRNEWDRVKPTLPLSYFVQGTAMWWTCMAMIRIHEQLKEWRRESGFAGFLTIQVHDECVLDFPYAAGMGNLPRIRRIVKLMEQVGANIGVPTPVNVEYHQHNWAEGCTVAI